MYQEFEADLLRSVMAGLAGTGLQPELVPAGPDSPAVLRFVVPQMGKIEQDVLFELLYNQNMEPDPEAPYSVLCIYATPFTGIPAESFAELDAACAYLNHFLVLGAFGTLGEGGKIYLRNNLLIRHSWPPEVYLAMALDSYGALKNTIEVTVDGLACVARGLCTTQQAIDKGLL